MDYDYSAVDVNTTDVCLKIFLAYCATRSSQKNRPFASSMFAPSIELVLAEFHSSSADLGTFVVSGYLLGYAFGPLGIAPLSELYGRLPLYHVSTLAFILFNLACAKSTNFPMLIVFRILTGIAGSTPLTLGPGSIADMFRQEERGKIMAVWTLPIMLGPTMGPLVGGYLSQAAGWRWDFWFLIIAVSMAYPQSYFQADMSPDWSSICHKSNHPKRDIPSIHFRTTCKKAPQIDWESISPIGLKVDQDP
jgi:multidrug resistance protein